MRQTALLTKGVRTVFRSKKFLRLQVEQQKKELEKMRALVSEYENEQKRCSICEHSRVEYETYPCGRIFYRCLLRDSRLCRDFKAVSKDKAEQLAEAKRETFKKESI